MTIRKKIRRDFLEALVFGTPAFMILGFLGSWDAGESSFGSACVRSIPYLWFYMGVFVMHVKRKAVLPDD